MLQMIPSVLSPFLALALVIFLILRLKFFSSQRVGGRLSFSLGGLLVFLATLWQATKLIPEYQQWFVVSAYPIIDLIQFLTLVLGVLTMVVGLALHADFWETRREEIVLREEKLSILENLQLDARQPYPLLELLNVSLREILVHYPMSAGAIFLVNRPKRQFVLTSFAGLTKDETSFLEYYPLGRNTVTQSVELGDPMIFSQFDFVDRSGRPVRSRFNSCLVLPLTSGMDKLGGVLLLSEQKQFFDRSDVRCLMPISQWLAEKIKSARSVRELTQLERQSQKYSDHLEKTLSRFIAASKAMAAVEPPAAFCRSFVGLAGSESVHLIGIQHGMLTVRGGSKPLRELSENYQTALVEALARARPVIINQESTDGTGKGTIVQSNLVCPQPVSGDQGAILLRRSDRSFVVDDHELRQLESLAWLAHSIFKLDESHRLGLVRRKGIESILQLLKADSGFESFADKPSYFLDHLRAVLPEASPALAFEARRDEKLHLIDSIGTGNTKQENLVIAFDCGMIGGAAVARQATFVIGRVQVTRELQTCESRAGVGLRAMMEGRVLPDILAACPILTGPDLVGVVVVAVPEADEDAAEEWKRFLTLAAELYSLRLTIKNSAARPGSQLSDSSGTGLHLVETVNDLNNHFSAIIGKAELIAQRAETTVEVRDQLAAVIAETEKAAACARRSLIDGTRQGSLEASLPDGGDDLSDIIRSVLNRVNVSGDLYMAGQRPREIQLRLEQIDALDFPSETLRLLFESVLDRFATLAHEDDIITVAVYMRDGYAYLDISRHRRNFPPVEHVAGFGLYQTTEEAFENRPGDIYLRHLSGSRCYYTIDKRSTIPTYLSFKFPLAAKAIATSKTNDKRIVRLLVIDDQAVILDLISAMGASLGYQVITAASGEEGLRLAGDQEFDIVLTDLALPGISGLEVARRLQQVRSEVPVVLVTGWEAGLDQSELISAGIVRVLHKPFRIEQLTDVVQSVITRNVN